MSVFFKFDRKNGGSVSPQTIKNLQTKMTSELSGLWVKIHQLSSESKVSKSTKSQAKKCYVEIVRKESLITLCKIIMQQLNFGLQLPEINEDNLDKLNTNYNNIFKIQAFKARREELLVLAEHQKNEHLPIKYINKELAHLNKVIDKTQYKINQFNASSSIDLAVLGPGLEKEYYRMVA